METEELVSLLESGEQEDVRGEIFCLEGENIEDQPLFPHQMESLRKVYENDNTSGIIKYPTGGGKTRTALGYMAREMERKDNRTFIWATYPTDNIRQGMVRLAELSGEFRDDTTVCWYDSYMSQIRETLEGIDILFCMRDHLTDLLENALDSRVTNGILQRVYDPREDEDDLDLTIIYDECHQLGADALQNAWLRFVQEYDCDIHTIGLSATPVPTKPEDCFLLQEEIFPIQRGEETERPEWDMQVHHDVTFGYLQNRGVLAGVDTKWTARDAFDLTVKCGHIDPPPPNPTNQQLNEFIEQFNTEGMAQPSVIKALAEDIAENIEELRKTLAFVPTIPIANRLLEEMETYESLKGRCTMVHSQLGQFVDSEEDIDVVDRNKQVQKFRERGDEPCVMLNVGMLTTGFDDPNIRSVILARLTTSTNLFWQMLGRGMRGPEVGGTKQCSIIDPIRLGAKHQAVEGYRASIEDACQQRAELLERDPEELQNEIITDTKDEVPENPYEVSDDCKESVRRALEHFAEYDTFRDAIDESEWSTFGWCHKLIRQAEERLDTDLDWMKNEDFLPDSSLEVDTKVFHRKVELCLEEGIKTREQWVEYLTTVL